MGWNVSVDADKCVGCGECVDVCLGCESCVEVCEANAIVVEEN